MQCNVKVGKIPVNLRKLHMVHTLRFGKSTKVAHGRTRVKIKNLYIKVNKYCGQKYNAYKQYNCILSVTN